MRQVLEIERQRNRGPQFHDATARPAWGRLLPTRREHLRHSVSTGRQIRKHILPLRVGQCRPLAAVELPIAALVQVDRPIRQAGLADIANSIAVDILPLHAANRPQRLPIAEVPADAVGHQSQVHRVGPRLPNTAGRVHEDVRGPIRVCRHQVGRGRHVRDPSSVAADRGGIGRVAGGRTVPTDRHHPDLSRLAIVDEDVVGPIHVANDQVRSAGAVGHEAAVATEGEIVAVVVGFRPAGTHADAFDLAGVPVVDEDVSLPIRVAGHEIRRPGHVRDIPAVAAQGRIPAGDVPLDPGGRDTDSLGRSCLPIAEEDVGLEVAVARHEIGRRRVEGEVASVGAQRGTLTIVISQASGRRDAGEFDGGRLPVIHEDVFLAVGVACNQIGRTGHPGDEAAVGTDRRRLAVVVRLRPAGRHAHPLDRSGLAIDDEDVAVAVRVPRDQVGCGRDEGDIAPVGADRRIVTGLVSLDAASGQADPLGRAQLPIEHKDVVSVVRISGHQIGRKRRERYVAAVTAERRVSRSLVALNAGGGHADALLRHRRAARSRLLPVGRQHFGHHVLGGVQARERVAAVGGRDRRGLAGVQLAVLILVQEDGPARQHRFVSIPYAVAVPVQPFDAADLARRRPNRDGLVFDLAVRRPTDRRETGLSAQAETGIRPAGRQPHLRERGKSAGSRLAGRPGSPRFARRRRTSRRPHWRPARR